MTWGGEATSSAFRAGIVSYLSGASQAYRFLGKPGKESQNGIGRFPRTGERQGDYNHLPPLLSSLFVPWRNSYLLCSSRTLYIKWYYYKNRPYSC